MTPSNPYKLPQFTCAANSIHYLHHKSLGFGGDEGSDLCTGNSTLRPNLDLGFSEQVLHVQFIVFGRHKSQAAGNSLH
jgi:hypothetical protein